MKYTKENGWEKFLYVYLCLSFEFLRLQIRFAVFFLEKKSRLTHEREICTKYPF